MFVYPAGPESLKKGKTLFIVCLSDRAGKFKRGQKLLIGHLSCRARKFKRKAKSCLLFVYPTGPGNLKEAKSFYCLFIWHARKFKKAAKSCLLIVYPAGSGSLKEEKSCKLIIYL